MYQQEDVPVIVKKMKKPGQPCVYSVYNAKYGMWVWGENVMCHLSGLTCDVSLITGHLNTTLCSFSCCEMLLFYYQHSKEEKY